MIANNRLPEESHDYLHECFTTAEELLSNLEYAGRIDAPLEELIETVGYLLVKFSRFSQKLWPRGTTRTLELLAELAACFIAQSRAPVPPSFLCWRNLLQATYDSLDWSECKYLLPSPEEQRNQVTHFLFIAAAVAECDRRATNLSKGS